MDNVKITKSAQAALDIEITKIRETAAMIPDSDFVVANEHVLKGEVKTWSSGGTMQLGGLVFWALNCDIIFTDFKHGFKFTAKGGPDLAVTAVACAVAGSFVVDPATIPSGKCRFTLKQGSFEEGYVTLSLYSTGGIFYGSLSGLAEGFGLASLSGGGSLSMAG